MTALIGDATDFARVLGLAAGGPSPSHHVGANSADVTGIAGSTLLRPHALARSMAATEGARFAGDSVGSNRTRGSAEGRLRTICTWIAGVIGTSHRCRGSHCG